MSYAAVRAEQQQLLKSIDFLEQSLQEKTKLIAAYREKYGGISSQKNSSKGPLSVNGGSQSKEAPRACEGASCIIT